MYFQLKTSLLLIALLVTNAWAGSANTKDAILNPTQIAEFAKSVEKYAASNGARVFILARIGRPEEELPEGIQFTHTAIAIYSSIQLVTGETVKGYAIHNLYQDAEKPDVSSLVIDYPVDFFWGVHSLKAGIIIPTPELQAKIIDSFLTGKNQKVHNSNYSVIANPFNAQFQNCTEHTLDIINASIYETTDIAKLKVNAKAHFKPQRVRTSGFRLLLGSMFLDDVTTKDHDGKVYTATFTSIGHYLNDNGLASKMVILGEEGNITSLL